MGMTQEQIADAGQVMIAFADGEVIESRQRNFHEEPNIGWEKNTNPSFNWTQFEYRRKPEPTYRPFTSEEWAERVGVSVRKKATPLPVILVTYVGIESVVANGSYISFSEMLDSWTFLDGSPCGAVVTNAE